MYTQFITCTLMVTEQGRRKMCLLCHEKPQIVTWARCVAYSSSEVKLTICGPLCLMQKPLLYEAITERVCTPIGIYSACIECIYHYEDLTQYLYDNFSMRNKMDIPFDSSHLSSEVALISPVSLTDHMLRDTRFLQHYCWFKSSEILCHQLINSYWCFEGSRCLHPLTVKKKALQSSEPLANIYHSTRHDIPDTWNIRLHSSQTGGQAATIIHVNLHIFGKSGTHIHMVYQTHLIWLCHIWFYTYNIYMIIMEYQ